METRVRFAPSPTGHLHVGGARTALFNWLYAKQTAGKFILRIDDTDTERSTENSVEQILASLKWLGIDYDEYYRQTERTHIYLDHATTLLGSRKAYWCDCTAEVLAEQRGQALKNGRKPGYSGRCRNRNLCVNSGTVLRFLSNDIETSFTDLVYGKITVKGYELDDFIILRSDNTPTYNFCVVVDDILMKITHVIRGADHISNTPRQIQLYHALKYTPPQFAHIPLILGIDKKRLSKRNNASSVLEYKELGYLPEVLLNYLALLGWSHGRQEEFTVDKLVEYFTFNKVSKSGAVFDVKKMLWLNGKAIQRKPPTELLSLSGLSMSLLPAVGLFAPRSKTLLEFRDGMKFLYSGPLEYDPKGVTEFFSTSGLKVLKLTCEKITNVQFTENNLKVLLDTICQELQLGLVNVAQPIRLALTGRTASPGLYEVMQLLGKDLTVERLRDACQYIIHN